MIDTISTAIFIGIACNIKEEKTKTGKPMLTFTLKAIKEIHGQKVPVYHNIVAYADAALAMSKYLHDGSWVYLDCDISKLISKEEKYQFVVKRFFIP